MKGFELVKREDHWALYNEDGHKIAATIDGCNSKLSIKNCEAIANGYDLDELAEKHYGVHIKHGHTEEDSLQRKIDFILGFVSALEILGDKKFSEEDVKRAMDVTLNYETKRDAESYQEKIDFLKSLQQTEWDVEIEMECPQCKEYGYISECRNVCNKKFIQPKLDADGCLILKRIDYGSI